MKQENNIRIKKNDKQQPACRDCNRGGIGGGDCCNNRNGRRKKVRNGIIRNTYDKFFGRHTENFEEQFVTEMKRKIKPVEGKQKTYEIDIKKHQTLYKNFLNLIPDIMEDPKFISCFVGIPDKPDDNKSGIIRIILK